MAAIGVEAREGQELNGHEAANEQRPLICW